MILFMCLLTLAGCKKEKEDSAGVDPAVSSVVAAPANISAAEAQATLPSGAMRGLSVPAPDSQPQTLPEMKPVNGMDISVRLSQRMASTPGWTRNFAALYKPVNDCLEQINDGASVTSVKIESAQVSVTIAGLNGAWQECRIEATGGQALSITTTREQPYSGPVFFPRAAGTPVISQPHCMELESVVARPGGLIGWLGFQKQNCL